MKIKKAGFALLEGLVVTAILMILGGIFLAVFEGRKSSQNKQQQSVSGVEKARANAAVKHLYVISAYSGQVIIHSVVRGKVETFGQDEMGARRNPGYLRWCDTNGASHELYVSDRIVIHISDEPPSLQGDSSRENAGPKLEADK